MDDHAKTPSTETRCHWRAGYLETRKSGSERGRRKGHFMYLVGVLLYHFAHEQREDGRHSPAEVLGWVTGKQFEPDYMYRTFAAIGETRTLTKVGYARFRDFLLYGERGLAGNKVLINIFQDTLALEYEEHPWQNIPWSGNQMIKVFAGWATRASTIIPIKVLNSNSGQPQKLSGI